MKKIKIAVQGWECFSGMLGNITFKDGISEEIVSIKDRERIGGTIYVEEFDEENPDLPGEQVGSTVSILKIGDIAAEMENTLEYGLKESSDAEILVTKTKQSDRKIYPLEELEAIATEKGIKAIRELAVPYDLKGTSIQDLIDRILKAQDSYLMENGLKAVQVLIETPIEIL
jgi:antitoxin component HigA of HigAB toxin-antitoxin module